MKNIKDFFIKLGRVYGFGPSWGAYLNLKDEAPFLREKDPYYVVENRIKEICKFQAKHSGLGVRFESDAHVVLHELVSPVNSDASFVIERVIPKAMNAAIFIPVFHGRLVLCRSYRYAIHQDTFEFFKTIRNLPSYRPNDLASAFHELSGIPEDSLDEPIRIGSIYSDPNQSHQEISVFTVHCTSLNFHFSHFGSKEKSAITAPSYDRDFLRADAMTDKEVDHLIAINDFRDAQSLAAYNLYRCSQ